MLDLSVTHPVFALRQTNIRENAGLEELLENRILAFENSAENWAFNPLWADIRNRLTTIFTEPTGKVALLAPDELYADMASHLTPEMAQLILFRDYLDVPEKAAYMAAQTEELLGP